MWEVVTAVGNDIRSDRQEVIGGWIVRKIKIDEYGRTVEQNFVSDPAHKWQVHINESYKSKTGNLKERVNVMGDKGGRKDKEKYQK